MILISDSGSTKCDWALCSNQGEIIKLIQTIGLNPNFISKEEILNTLKNSDLNKEKNQVTKIIFYGASCSTKMNKEFLTMSLGLFFQKAKIEISHDLDAAAFAVYRKTPCIVGILGTGSNACYFDGLKISQKKPSLGFILGDEGSGNYFGKKLLQAYYNNTLPQSIKQNFELSYKLSFDEFIHRVYQGKQVNVFLADFFKFIYQHKKKPYLDNMLSEGINLFFKNYILCYRDYNKVPISFVGSVAYLLSSYINTIGSKYNCTINSIIKSPIKSLVQYHTQST